MNNYTPSLGTAQRQASPKYGLHGHFFAANPKGGSAPTDWEFFNSQPANLNLSWPGDYWQIAACGYGEYYIAQAYLNWRSGRLDFRIFDSDNNSDFTHNVHNITTFATGGNTPLPAICYHEAEASIYIFYQLPTGNIYVINSTSISLSSSAWNPPTLITSAPVGSFEFMAATYNNCTSW